MNIEERLNSLKSSIDTAKQKKLRAEMEAETALRERDEALSALKQEFDVDSIEEANLLLKKLKQKLSQDVEKAESILKELT